MHHRQIYSNGVVALMVGMLLVSFFAPGLAERRISRRALSGSSTFFSADSSCYLIISWSDTSHTDDRLIGRLYRLSPAYSDQLLWQAPLVYTGSTDAALVASDGVHVVTYQPTGAYGDNVVALYGESGKPIRKYSLPDICPCRPEKEEKPRAWAFDAKDPSYWGSGHIIDEAAHQLVLRVIPNAATYRLPQDEHVEVRVDLRNGDVLTPLNHPAPSRGAPDILWTRKYDPGMKEAYCEGVAAATRGGFFYAVHKGADWRRPVPPMGLLIRISSAGDTLWSRPIIVSENVGVALTPTSDDGVILVAQYGICSGEHGQDYKGIAHFERRDKNGEVIWEQDQDSQEIGGVSAATTTSDGGIVFACVYGVSGRNELRLRKLNSAGNLAWARSYPSRYEPSVSGIAEMTNGDLLLVGGGDYAVFRASSSGDSLWRKETAQTGLSALCADRQGGALYSVRGSVLQHIDAKGDRGEAVTVAKFADIWIGSTRQTEDGGWIAAGNARKVCGRDNDFFIARWDKNMHTLWWKTFGTVQEERVYCIEQTPDGGYLACGASGDVGFTGSIWVVKLAAK